MLATHDKATNVFTPYFFIAHYILVCTLNDPVHNPSFI